MTLTTWILIALALVWLLGTPIAYGAEKRGSSHPVFFQYGAWPGWAIIWAVGEIIDGLKFVVLYVWRTLEDLGSDLADPVRR